MQRRPGERRAASTPTTPAVDTASDPTVLADIASKYPGVTLSAGQTNKYQVVLIFSSPLATGNYQIVVNRRRPRRRGQPVVRHRQQRQRLGRLGGAFRRQADHARTATISPNGTLSYNTADAVASDAEGDSVAVWVDPATGIWAGIYDQTTTANADGTQSTSFSPVKQFQVTTDTTATDASVAIDKDGDFVVTWSGLSATTSTDWDVYAETFYANGNIHTSTFMVNTTTLGTQRSSSVAMDLRGDFVITWESRTAITSSTGYDIDAERFSDAGNVLAGTDEEQSITFDSAFSGTFSFVGTTTTTPTRPTR